MCGILTQDDEAVCNEIAANHDVTAAESFMALLALYGLKAALLLPLHGPLQTPKPVAFSASSSLPHLPTE